MSLLLCLVDKGASLGTDVHLLRVHLVLGKVFHLDVVEVAQSAVQCDVCKVDALNLHTLHQLA